jgi:hypothetical protein
MQIVFLRNRQNPDYYFLAMHDYEIYIPGLLNRLHHTGPYTKDSPSPFPKEDVELAYVFDVKLDYSLFDCSIDSWFNKIFFDYLVKNVATNYIPHRKFTDYMRYAWLEFKSYEPEKWLADFYEDYKAQTEAKRKSTQKTEQLSLF